MIKYKLQQLRDGRGKWQSLPDDEQVLQQEFDKVFFTVVQEAEKHAKGTHVESEIGRLYLSNEIYCAGTMRYASESGSPLDRINVEHGLAQTNATKELVSSSSEMFVGWLFEPSIGSEFGNPVNWVGGWLSSKPFQETPLSGPQS
eukprot:2455359-Amphidinium_carterae.1